MPLSLADRLLLLCLHRLGKWPFKRIHRLGKVLYYIALFLPLGMKTTIRTNVTRCLPGISAHARKILVRQTFYHIILKILEMPFFWFGLDADIADKVHRVIGMEAFDQAFQQGKGILVITPHLGASEMVNVVISKKYPAACFYKPFKKAYQEVLVRNARERTGVLMLPTTLSGTRLAFRALKEGHCLGIASDHDPGKNGSVLAPFFNILVPTTTLTCKFIRKSGSPVFYAYALRLPDGKGFDIHLVAATNPALKSEDEITAATALNSGIEQCILASPEQYEWNYKRFRHTLYKGRPFYE